MCGIAGILYYNGQKPVQEIDLKRMTDAMVHRGPDGVGFYINANVGLAHRRLSIIDLQTGNQPMHSADGQISIVFNGEIYNYIELRNKLRSLGYSFTTESDTEVIINAYKQWGINCLKEFIGCWAFALWDNTQKTLFVTRDRMGEKPLHYSVTEQGFIFASEIKGLLALNSNYKKRWDLIDIYLTLGYIPAPYTFFQGIEKLEAGHYLKVHDGNVQNVQYWDLPVVDEHEMNSNTGNIYEQFEYLLKESVKIQMRSDVPYGAFLSGGLDSASIVALMSEQSAAPVQTFTMGFENPDFDERSLAGDVAKKFSTNHHTYLVEPGLFEKSLDHAVYYHDEPFGDSSSLPTSQVSAFARQHITVVLTGDGGDEVLSGYRSYQGEKLIEKFSKIPGLVRSLGISTTQGLSSISSGSTKYRLGKISRVLKASNEPYFKRQINTSTWVERELLTQLIQQRDVISVEDYLQHFFSTCPYNDGFYKLMWFHYKISLPYDMLVKVDRMSMSHSLEARVPFLDHRLVELMATVHKNVKMQGYERKTVLRNTVAKKLPTSLLNAPKKGFAVPLRDWFKDTDFNEKIERLCQSNLPLNKEVLRKIISSNNSGKKDYGNFIWMLFMLNRYA